MSELTIEKLPEDAMVEVLKWLDPKSLKNAVLTCKQWKGIIERNIPWKLRHLKYKKHRVQEDWFELVLSSNRKFGNVTIDGLMWTAGSAGLDANTLEIFGKHGESIRELNLKNSPLISATMWCQLLTTMPQLETLKMDNVTALVIKEDGSNIAQKPTLKKLKKVELLRSRCDMLTHIVSCKLKTLKIYANSSNLKDREPLLIFLATQEGLQELIYHFYDVKDSDKLFEPPIHVNATPFRLKKLSLQISNESSTQPHNDNLEEFVLLHKKTLEDLDLDYRCSNAFFTFVFTGFKKLKSLSLSEKSIPKDPSFIKQLKVNRNVTILKLSWDWDLEEDSDESLLKKNLLSRLPNIQKLSVDDCFGSFAEHIAGTMKNLKDLTVTFFVDSCGFNGSKFHALESLSIECLGGPVNWNAITKNNPGIKELSIGLMEKPKYLKLTVITKNLKQLRKLTIQDPNLSCNAKFFNTILKNCHELKSLELHVKSLKVDIASVADYPGLRFRAFRDY